MFINEMDVLRRQHVLCPASSVYDFTVYITNPHLFIPTFLGTPCHLHREFVFGNAINPGLLISLFYNFRLGFLKKKKN
jgi:hypothetical protein